MGAMKQRRGGKEEPEKQAEKEGPETQVRALSSCVSRECLQQTHGPEQKPHTQTPVLGEIQCTVKAAFQTSGGKGIIQ